MRIPMIAMVALLGVGACAPAADDDARTVALGQAVVRVDQVGYTSDETKHAYLVSQRPAAGAPFRVVDESGRTVLRGKAGAPTGSWNGKYRAVNVLDFSKITTPGRYRVEVDGTSSPRFRVAGRGDLFGRLAADNVRFFRSQRDGANVDGSLLRRKPSHLADRAADVYAPPRIDMDAYRLLDPALTRIGGPVDVEGGWFDAGDFLKFTHTTSYATAQLLLAQRDGTGGAGDTALAAEARHGVDWLAKMWTGDVLYAQVGIGVGNENVRTDHDVWRLPEDDDRLDVQPGSPDFHIKNRPVFPANQPGAPISPNLAGRVAAVFALSAQLNAQQDRGRAIEHLRVAAELYARADRNPGALVTAYPPEYYPESSWLDDLEFGATELALAARALGDPRAPGWTAEARQWAARYVESDSRGSAGISDVSAMAHADLAVLADGSQRQQLIDDIRRPLRDAVAIVDKDPFSSGVSYVDFDAVPHTFGLMISALLNKKLTGDTTYDQLLTRQRNWALGANPWGVSFVIGTGTTSLRCASHQVANLTGEVPLGAVVNGPNAARHFEELNTFPTVRACPQDGGNPYAEFDGKGARFLDHAGAWASAEVAIDFTSTALLAFTLAAR